MTEIIPIIANAFYEMWLNFYMFLTDDEIDNLIKARKALSIDKQGIKYHKHITPAEMQKIYEKDLVFIEIIDRAYRGTGEDKSYKTIMSFYDFVKKEQETHNG